MINLQIQTSSQTLSPGPDEHKDKSEKTHQQGNYNPNGVCVFGQDLVLHFLKHVALLARLSLF
jgi:hypothetical protein